MTKAILDACCGSRMFWFDKDDPNVIYLDKRQNKNLTIWEGKSGIRTIDIMPDIVADFRNLPFDDETFYHVVFDPPHLVRAGDNSWMKKKYGELPKDWESMLKKGFDECWRVLKKKRNLDFQVERDKNTRVGSDCSNRTQTHVRQQVRASK